MWYFNFCPEKRGGWKKDKNVTTNISCSMNLEHAVQILEYAKQMINDWAFGILGTYLNYPFRPPEFTSNMQHLSRISPNSLKIPPTFWGNILIQSFTLDY